ncbi:MAG: hypothetical protein PVJ02_18990 [Gemmatimonadota bacterium]
MIGSTRNEGPRHGLLWRHLAVLLALGLSTACNSFPFGNCSIRVIESTLPAVWSFEGDTMQVDWFDRLSETNLDPGTFTPIADAFASADKAVGSLSWLISAFDTIPGFIGVRMAVPVTTGDRIRIDGVAPVGGFGLSSGRIDGARVDVRMGDFRATGASGELEVLSVFPLTVRLTLTTSDEAGRTLTLRGDQTFRVFERESECS